MEVILCPPCSGSGRQRIQHGYSMVDEGACPLCDGEGVITSQAAEDFWACVKDGLDRDVMFKIQWRCAA